MTLVEYFNRNRQGGFREAIGRAKTIDDVYTIILHEITAYTVPTGEYVKSLTMREAASALPLLQLLTRLSGDIHQAAKPIPSRPRQHATLQGTETTSPGNGSVIRVAVAATSGSIVGSFFGPVGSIVGASVGTGSALLINSLLDHRKSSRSTLSVSSQSNVTISTKKSAADSTPIIEIDVDRLCESLVSLFENIDDLVSEHSRQVEPEQIPFHSAYMPFLQLLQELQTAVNNHDDDHIRSIAAHQARSLLRGLGYDLVEDVVDPSDVAFFEMFSSDEVATKVILCPAIFTDGKLVLKGRMLVPEPKSASKNE